MPVNISETLPARKVLESENIFVMGIYGFDSRIKAILNTDERRIADVAPPQDPKRDLATAKSNQEILRRVERREAQNPLVFFERLFR